MHTPFPTARDSASIPECRRAALAMFQFVDKTSRSVIFPGRHCRLKPDAPSTPTYFSSRNLGLCRGVGGPVMGEPGGGSAGCELRRVGGRGPRYPRAGRTEGRRSRSREQRPRRPPEMPPPSTRRIRRGAGRRSDIDARPGGRCIRGSDLR